MWHITYVLNGETMFLINVESEEKANVIVKKFKEINPTIEFRCEQI